MSYIVRATNPIVLPHRGITPSGGDIKNLYVIFYESLRFFEFDTLGDAK